MHELALYRLLESLVFYDKESGKIFWIEQNPYHNKGDECGNLHSDGYRSIYFKGHHILTHRFVFWLETGEIPRLVDHKDGNRLNNHISNLRIATRQENNRNSQVGYGLTGVRGVTYDKEKEKYRARIKDDDGKCIHLGYFQTLEDAKHARNQKARELFGEFYQEN